MTDPRINPAGTPGGSGSSEPGSAPQSPRPGSSGSNPAGAGASSTGTATRTPAGAGATVPQQTGQAAQPRSSQEYGRAQYAEQEYVETVYGETSQASNMLASAAKMSWMVLLLGALVMIGLGICLLVWPHASLTVVAILIGCAIIATGLVKLYEGFTARGGESGGLRAAYIVIGLLAVLAGVYCLRHHAVSVFLLAFVTGVYFIAHGVADIGAGASAPRGSGRGLRITLGLFSIAAGVILVIWPGISLTLLLLIMGAWLLFYGLVLAGLAFSLRRTAKNLTESATTTTAMPARAA